MTTIDFENPVPLVRPSFIVMGDEIDPNKLTKVTGVIPSEIGIKGYKPEYMKVPFENTFWEFGIERRSHNIEDPISDLLAVIWEKRFLFRKCLQGKKFTNILYCAVSVFVDQIEYSVSELSLQKTVDLQARFSLDIIDYSE